MWLGAVSKAKLAHSGDVPGDEHDKGSHSSSCVSITSGVFFTPSGDTSRTAVARHKEEVNSQSMPLEKITIELMLLLTDEK